MNVAVLGDIHGEWGKLNQYISSHDKIDIFLQTGDFGWWPKFGMTKGVIYGQKSWNHKGIKLPPGKQLYFCDGNHEDHWDLEVVRKHHDCSHPIEMYQGIFYCPRGCTLELPDGRKVLFMGGASSIDKDQRTLGVDWFPEETISNADVERALSLETPIDIVISHTVPEEWVPDSTRPEKLNDCSRPALSAILKHFKPSLWYSGHWHHERSGEYEGTKWYALDYPGHGGRWWRLLE